MSLRGRGFMLCSACIGMHYFLCGEEREGGRRVGKEGGGKEWVKEVGGEGGGGGEFIGVMTALRRCYIYLLYVTSVRTEIREIETE